VDSPPPPGCNTDALLDGLDRYDDCHIGGVGAEKVAQAWPIFCWPRKRK
jgi:hypothetical protein